MNTVLQVSENRNINVFDDYISKVTIHAFQLGYEREVRENLRFISGLHLLSLSLRTILSVEVDFQSSQSQSQFRALSTLDSNYTFRQLP